VKIALLGSFTLDVFAAYLRSRLEHAGRDAACFVGGFGRYAQDILDRDSGYYRFGPDVTFLLLDGQDVFRDLFRHPLDFPAEVRMRRVEHEVEQLSQLVRTITEHLPACTVFLNTIAAPGLSGLGLLEGHTDYSVKDVVRAYNAALERLVRQHPRLRVVDVESLVLRVGADRWADDRMWYLARMPLSHEALTRLAGLYATSLKALTGQTKKCLVLDLDNTLWGGVLGEDGVEGLRLGSSGIGEAYVDFQREILNFVTRSIREHGYPPTIREIGAAFGIRSPNGVNDHLKALTTLPFDDLIASPNEHSSARLLSDAKR